MYPFVLIAGVMALYFAVATLQRPRPAEFLALGLWAAYAVYEYYIANGTLCDANCNIRVDLVLFFPLLGIASYLARQETPRPGAVATLYVVCLGLTAWIASLFGYTAVSVIAGIGAVVALVYGVRSAIQAKRA